MNIVVDVDLTVVRSDILWWKELREGYELVWGTKAEQLRIGGGDRFVKHYDLSKYFPDIPEELRYKFWSKPNLYQELPPIKRSVETLKHFSDQGARIIFASYCKKGHFGSKYDWLKEHYPFMDGFIATKEKHFVKADVFIDDRNAMLNRRYEEGDGCQMIKYNSPYTQDEKLIDSQGIYVAEDWDQVKIFIEGGELVDKI